MFFLYDFFFYPSVKKNGDQTASVLIDFNFEESW